VPRATLLQMALCSLVLASGPCCRAGPTGPSRIAISAVSPATGSTFGGTPVTVTGSGFDAGTTLLIGTAPAENVQVVSATAITATTAQSPAGTVDVAVSAHGVTATLPRAFTYTAPVATVNAPPTIVSLSARGTRSNEPAQFADLGERLTLQAVVQDAETPTSQLDFQWTSDTGGTFDGSGQAVSWQAPLNATTPASIALTLTVVEKYQAADDRGLPITKENRTAARTVVDLHDSVGEISQLARLFLLEFSDSNIRDASFIVRNFSDLCPAGKAAELSDVIHNRQHFRINRFSVGLAATRVDFKGTCPFRNQPADACAQVPVDWDSTVLDDNSREHVIGTDQVTAVYDTVRRRWGLCASDFNGRNASTASGVQFIR
jgi:hypothetical protein